MTVEEKDDASGYVGSVPAKAVIDLDVSSPTESGSGSHLFVETVSEPIADSRTSELNSQRVRAPRTRLRHGVSIFVVTLVVALASGAIWRVTDSASNSGYSAQVSSYGIVPLNFASSGQIATINVSPGSAVKAGQTLATLDGASANATIARDQAQIKIDQGYINSLTSIATSLSQPGATENSKAALNNYISAAQNSLSEANNEFQDQIAQATTNLSFAKQVLSADQSIYVAQCPNGPVSQTNNLPTAQCIQLADGLAQAQINVNDATSTLLSLQDAQRAAIADASRNLASAQAAEVSSFQSSNNSINIQLASAQATLNADNAKLNQDLASLSTYSIVAPEAGVVSQINGSVGEAVTSSGVPAIIGSAAAAPVSAAGSIFPTSHLESAVGSSTEPLILLKTKDPFRVTALIPESAINSIRIGTTATFTPSVSGTSTVNIKVIQKDAFPLVVGGQALYPVTFALTSTEERGFIQGLTGTVKIR